MALTAVRKGLPAVPSVEETSFEAVAEEAFRRQSRRWKPSTPKVNRWYVNNQILPWFRGRQIAEINSQDVRDWFASMHATPVSADWSMSVLSVIIKVSEADGLGPEGSNPCRGSGDTGGGAVPGGFHRPAPCADRTSVTGTSICATARRAPARSGCRRRPARFSTVFSARRPVCFLPEGPAVRFRSRSSAMPGPGSGLKDVRLRDLRGIRTQASA